MNLDDITPLVLTYNEEANLARTLAGVAWARQAVIVDSGSTDGTREIAAAHAGVRWVERPFDDFASQCNYGLAQVTTPWTLALDADYVCPPELAAELAGLAPGFDAFAAGFVYAIGGRPLRGTLYPPRVVLFRTERFRYAADGHAHKLDLAGAACGSLRSRIVHDDRKSLARWVRSQIGYAQLEADKLLGAAPGTLGWKDRLRRAVVVAPPLTLAYCLVGKRLLLDGWPGMYYALQRTFAELLLSLELVDRKVRGKR